VITWTIERGLPAGPNVLLTVRGRRSGRPRTTPVAMLESGDNRYLQASFGDVHWVRNLRAAGEATVTRRKRSRTVTAHELPDEAAAFLLRDSLAPFHRSRFLRWLLGSRVRPAAVLMRYHFRIDDSAEEYLAEVRRHPLFELRPAAAAPTLPPR
jgi:deazaflavin-dependent oxidoreductase (nitroreductase family)